jgi:aspartyl-tRNA(Asn)/glutamyl-tRNA(Gln) amidotransferase subunit A
MTPAASQQRIKQIEPSVHAFLEVFEHAGQNGTPIAVKDVICTTEGHTTAASKVLKNFRSPYEATVIQRLKKAGYVVIGKTNLDEFAMGSSTEYSALAATKNPWDPGRVPGGSSGGSAAAVAAGEVDVALGTDTGGSIRQPASFCGVVGLKPTYGRVSRFGIIAYGSSLDQVGPFARTVKQAAEVLAGMAGPDEHDATTWPEPPPDYAAACGREIKGLVIGVPREYFATGVDPEVARVVRTALDQLAALGAKLQEISLPLTAAAVPVYYLIAKAEASTNLARYDSLRYGDLNIDTAALLERYLTTRGNFGPEVKRTILMGAYALSAGYYDAWYKQASKVRTLIRREFEQAFTGVDVIAGPTAPEVAFLAGAKTDDPLSMYMSDSLTVPQSVAGLPAISVPCGFTRPADTRGKDSSDNTELPVGLQLTAPPFTEERLFQVSHAYEQSQEWWKQKPELPALSNR